MLETLDTLDKRILFELDRNSRQPISSVAKKLRQSRDRVEYRLERLVDQRIIKKFEARVDIYRLGFVLYKTYLRLENNKKRIGEFISHLAKHPRIYWIALCDGVWDLIIAVAAQNAYEFYTIHSKILSEFNELVLNFSAYTVVDDNMYSRNYLTKASRTHIRFGGNPQTYPIDQIDFHILQLLTKDARLSVTAISDYVKATPAVVRYRIERLEKTKIIQAYQIDLNLAVLRMLMCKAQFFLRNYEISLREKFTDYCIKHPNVSSYIQQVGDCNIELEFQVGSYLDYAHIIDEIRGEFSKLIRNFHSILIRDSHRFPMPREIPGLIPYEEDFEAGEYKALAVHRAS